MDIKEGSTYAGRVNLLTGRIALIPGVFSRIAASYEGLIVGSKFDKLFLDVLGHPRSTGIRIFI